MSTAALKMMAQATPEDYVRDPTRWGSREVAAHFPDFAHLDVRTSDSHPSTHGVATLNVCG